MDLLGHRWLVIGGIGTGKSAVCDVLEANGWLRINADKVGHEILEPGGPGFEEVGLRWPEVVVNGHIDRKALGRIVFSDESQLRELEGITHPLIFDIIESRIQGVSSPIAVELPFLDKSPSGVWSRMVIDADEMTRVDRVVGRGSSRSDAEMRMAAQPDRARWLATADLVVPNHGDLAELADTVSRILASLADS